MTIHTQNEQIIEDMTECWRIRRLFRAVLFQAAKDAYKFKPKSVRQRKRRKEALCFFKNAEDLSTICDLAGAPYRDIWQVTHCVTLGNQKKYNKIISLTFKKASVYY